MYGEFFDIPEPDELVFVSGFSGGEVFRSGCCWRRGKGKVFYFSPGDQEYPVYHHPDIKRVLANAVQWAAPDAADFTPPAVRTSPARSRRTARGHRGLAHDRRSTGRPLRAGVVGLGWAGQQHMAAYADLPRASTSSGSPGWRPISWSGWATATAWSTGRTTGSSCSRQPTSTWSASRRPTALHAPITIGALNAGLHVLSEKPMAETAAVAAGMVAAAEANDRVLDVSFNHRMRGDVQALKKIIDAGLLGNIYYAKAGWLRREGIPGLGSWFTRVATAGGGPLMDIGVHMLDMALTCSASRR